MSDDIPQQNTGVIQGSGTKQLWLGGTIPYEIRLESGDWRPYLVKEEKQFSNNADTMGCVSFSLTNDLEIQNKFLGIEVNFSDRFLAKMSETTHQGNYLDKVADTARKIGLVLESEYPTPESYTWDSYYATISPEIVSKAIKQEIAYEEVSIDKESLLKHLKQCPLQITIPHPHPNHAVVLVAIEGDTAFYFDSYPPYLKTINLDKISYALKVVLKGSMNPNVKTINIDGTIYAALALSDPKEIPFINKFLNINLVQNPDGTIPTDIMAKEIK